MLDPEPNEVSGTAAVADLPAEGVVIDVPDEIAASESKETSDEAGKDAASTTDDDFLDLETFMLAEDDDDKGKEPDAAAAIEGKTKEEDTPQQPETVAALTAELKALRETLAKLPADQLAEKQNKSFGAMRSANEKILARVDQVAAQLTDASRFGEPERIREAVELQDSLYEYDVKEGYVSPAKFAQKLGAKDPEHAFRTAALLLAQPGDDKGTPLVNGFVTNVLQLDMNRLEAFQAISRGEIPNGYEGLNLTLDEDLQAIPSERHSAFKRLTSGQQEIIRTGIQKYSTEFEKSEAKRVLEDSQQIVNSDTNRAREAAEIETSFRIAIDTHTEKAQVGALTSVHDGIGAALSKIVFSTDKVVDSTIRYGVNRAIFDFENPVFRANAEKHFVELGIPAVEVKQVGKEVARLLDELDNTIQAKAFATARMEKAQKLGNANEEKLQKQESQRADEAYQSRIKRLKVLGIGLAAKVSQKAGAKLAKQQSGKVPENVQPVVKSESSSNGSRKQLSARDYAAAGARGEILSRN